VTIGLPSMDRLPSLDRLTALERGITIGDFLVPIRVSEGIGVRVRHVALIAVGVVLIALAAQVRFYVPPNPIPYTGQTFAVLLVGGALGVKRGLAATLAYLLLGTVGLPIFAGGTHGLAVLTGVTGGYLVGFLLAAALAGRLAEFGWDRHLIGSIGAMALATVPIYLVGVPWFAYVTGMSLGAAVAQALTPFLLGDSLKILAAAVLFPAAWWVVGRRPGDR
jgi:biotin transport system substrate-specific component